VSQAVVVYGTAIAVAALVLYGALRAFWRRPGSAQDPAFGPPPPDINVVGRTRVGIGRSLVLVDVQGRRLLLGSTSRQWTALADLGAARHAADDETDGAIEMELARAIEASRQRRGGRRS
jgi:flagellar biogenesis protein FliO